MYKSTINKNSYEFLSPFMEKKFFMTKKEISRKFKINEQGVTSCLRRLIEEKTIMSYRQGRAVYYASINTLTSGAAEFCPQTYSCESNFDMARSCYGHLAGKLGVNLYKLLYQTDCIDLQENTVKFKNFNKLHAINKDFADKLTEIAELHSTKICLDCTERTFHLGGLFGQELSKLLVSEKYLHKNTSNSRVYTVTEKGVKFFDALINTKSLEIDDKVNYKFKYQQ